MAYPFGHLPGARGEMAEQGIDLAALRCDLFRFLQVLGCLVELLIAQVNEAAIGPPRDQVV